VVPFVKRSSGWYGTFYDHHPAFYVGNFNLYLTKNLTENVRTMGEVRFLYLPHGNSSLTTGDTVDNSVPDYADFGRPLRWGGIEIERVYLEWSALSHLTVRAGQFLTPYGIWNVDHGSPTFIPTQRPYVVGSNWFPERQTGFELFGNYDIGTSSTVGYHLTLSNGQGLASEYRDLDSNKAVGGRAYWQWRGLGELRIGASGYYGTSTNATYAPGMRDGHLYYAERITTQYRNLALAADALWNYKNLRLQAEILAQQVDYTDAGRVQGSSAISGRTNYPIDLHSWGGYFLAGYRFDWFGVMPYGLLQYIDQVTPATGVILDTIAYEAGLNIRPIDSVVLKLSYGGSSYPNGIYYAKGSLHSIQAQVAWAF
jgi:hypothetical protein